MFDDPVLADLEPVPGDDQRADPAADVGDEATGETAAAEATSAASVVPLEADGVLPPLGIEVIRSNRRTKTAQARLVGSTIEIRIPARCSAEEEQELVEHFTAKFERSRSADAIDLDTRAAALADRFGLPTPTSIRWVTNQQYRWGSCTPADGTIRLSNRLAEFPEWVIDYVIVHELAHLIVSGHNADFWALVEAYPLCERARGFLIAKGLDED